jgi:hypothetical protein
MLIPADVWCPHIIKLRYAAAHVRTRASDNIVRRCPAASAYRNFTIRGSAWPVTDTRRHQVSMSCRCRISYNYDTRQLTFRCGIPWSICCECLPVAAAYRNFTICGQSCPYIYTPLDAKYDRPMMALGHSLLHDHPVIQTILLSNVVWKSITCPEPIPNHNRN